MENDLQRRGSYESSPSCTSVYMYVCVYMYVYETTSKSSLWQKKSYPTNTKESYQHSAAAVARTTHCITLQYTATHCSTQQHTASMSKQNLPKFHRTIRAKRDISVSVCTSTNESCRSKLHVTKRAEKCI